MSRAFWNRKAKRGEVGKAIYPFQNLSLPLARVSIATMALKVMSYPHAKPVPHYLSLRKQQ